MAITEHGEHEGAYGAFLGIKRTTIRANPGILGTRQDGGR